MQAARQCRRVRHRHIGQCFAHQWVGIDCLTERLTLAGIGARLKQRPRHQAAARQRIQLARGIQHQLNHGLKPCFNWPKLVRQRARKINLRRGHRARADLIF